MAPQIPDVVSIVKATTDSPEMTARVVKATTLLADLFKVWICLGC